MEESRSNSDIGDGGAQGNHAVDSHMSSTLLIAAAMDQDQNVSGDEAGDFTQNELPNSSKHGDHTDNQEVLTYMDPDIYKAAVEGRIETFKNYPNPLYLDHLVTPNKKHCSPCLLDKRKEKSVCRVVRQLVKLSASLLMRANNRCEIPLHIAVKKGLHDVPKVLIDECRAQFDDLERGTRAAKQMLRMRNNEKETAMHMAVWQNSLEVVELLTREDPDFQHSSDNYGETPISIAARRKNLEFVTKMLDSCTSIDYRYAESSLLRVKLCEAPWFT